MKKIIKVLAIIAILMSSLIVLTACGGIKNKENNNEQINLSNTTTKTEEKKEANTKFIDNNESYYFIYNGVKIKAGDKTSTLSSAGLSIRDTQKDKEISSNSYSSCEITNSENKSIFTAKVFNKGTSKAKASDSLIGGVSVDTRGVSKDEKVAAMEVYGGIKIGSTIQELKKVFGEPDSSSTDSEYVYESKEVSRYFRFDIKDGKVTGITWMNRAF